MDQTINPFKNGNQTAFWAGVPPNYIGMDGYLCTDTTTGNQYQKVAGVWVLQFSGGTGGANVVKLGGANGTPGSNAVGTGTLTTFPIGTIAIPAGSLSGNNGVLTVVIAVGANNSASVKTLTATLNSQDLGVSYQMANLVAGEVTIRIQNKNATNAQQVRNTGSPNAALVQTTVDMTQAQNITILATLTTTGDTMNVTSYSWSVSNL